jgi:serine/threonine-protein kinase RsbW
VHLKKIRVKAKMENFAVCASFIEEQLEAAGFDDKAALKVVTACEEIIVNVVNYAYSGGEGDLEISFVDGGDLIKIIFTDRGKPFNPLEEPEADVTLPADERQIGGLGILMVKKLMDDVQYQYKDGQNMLTIIKKFNRGGS